MPEEPSKPSHPERVLLSCWVSADILEHKRNLLLANNPQLKRPRSREDCGCPGLNSQALSRATFPSGDP